jgi:hypothetical protein
MLSKSRPSNLQAGSVPESMSDAEMKKMLVQAAAAGALSVIGMRMLLGSGKLDGKVVSLLGSVRVPANVFVAGSASLASLLTQMFVSKALPHVSSSDRWQSFSAAVLPLSAGAANVAAFSVLNSSAANEISVPKLFVTGAVVETLSESIANKLMPWIS